MDKHEYEAGCDPSCCAAIFSWMDSGGGKILCGLPPSAECHNLLVEEEPESKDLLPCPFCGNTQAAYASHRHAVYCQTCTAEGPLAVYPASERDAIQLWNTRANSQLVTALVEALTEIAKGEGSFSCDPLTHAGNTIENMKRLATNALALLNLPLTQLPLEHTGLKSEREDSL